MALTIKDPLLAAARTLLWIIMIALGIAVVATLIAIPAMFIMQDRIAVELASEGAEIDAPRMFALVAGLLALVSVSMALLFRVFQLLKRIVNTVGEGDPFVPENARRLVQMAWLTLATELVSFPLIGSLVTLIDHVKESGLADNDDTFVINSGFDGSGILLVLILFILARVFREGARMREEIEGTV